MTAKTATKPTNESNGTARKCGRPPGSKHKPAAAAAIAAAPAAELQQLDGFQSTLKLDAICASPSNPRKNFDQAKLEDLAGSIGSKGVLQPILVRPFRACRVLEPLAAGDPELRDPDQAGKWRTALWAPGDVKPCVIDYWDTEDAALVECARAISAQRNSVDAVRFELVCGERRWRAARIAGLADIPAIVTELSDRDVLEIQCVENEQRDDVKPMERADAYARLVEEHGVSVEDLASRIGTSASTVRDLLKLRRLPEMARQAVDRGLIPPTTAALIARVPNELHRERVAIHVLNGEPCYQSEVFQDPKQVIKLRRADGDDDGVLSFRQTKDLIERCCMVELKGAPFDRNETDLVPFVPSCEACPKRGGNLVVEDPVAYAGVRADICTDPGCYRSKCQAHSDALLRKARDEGKDVMAPDRAHKLFQRWDPSQLDRDCGYVDLDAKCFEHQGGKKTWRKLLGTSLQDVIEVAVDPKGGVHELMPVAHAKNVLRKLGVKSPDIATSTADGDAKKREQDFNRKAKQGAAAAECALTLVADQMTKMLKTSPAKKSLELMREVVAALADRGFADECRTVVKRRRITHSGLRTSPAEVIQAEARTLDWDGLLTLLAELVAARRVHWWKSGHHVDTGGADPLLAAFGITFKEMVKRGKEVYGHVAGDDEAD